MHTLREIFRLTKHDSDYTIRIMDKVNGEILKHYREKAGLTPAQLAAESNVSERTIRGIEIGEKSAPSIRTLIKLANALGCGVIDFFGRLEVVRD